MYDSMGRRVAGKSISSFGPIDLSNLSDGMYVLVDDAEPLSVSQRLVKSSIIE